MLSKIGKVLKERGSFYKSNFFPLRVDPRKQLKPHLRKQRVLSENAKTVDFVCFKRNNGLCLYLDLPYGPSLLKHFFTSPILLLHVTSPGAKDARNFSSSL